MTYCLTEDRRRAGCAWLTAHGVDPGHVPLYAQITRDPVSGEWIIPVYATGPDGRHYIAADGDLARETVRIADDGNPPPAWLVQPTGDPRQAIVDAAIAWRHAPEAIGDLHPRDHLAAMSQHTARLIAAIDTYQEIAQ